MATEPFANVLRYIRHLGTKEADDQPSDVQLLQDFITKRDESAFARILERHGSLVFGVCRQVLHNSHDAEDAFQAAFLVLARKAASIRNQKTLAAWLHRVALNIARTVKTGTARRRAQERQATLMSQASPVDTVPSCDLRSLLHEEVDRLPEKYRLPVVLFYLEGKTHEEAARQLGWPLGTVKGRLSRARDLLRTRLERRGIALTAAGLVATLAESAAGAVPPTLLGLTLRAAVSFAASGAIAGGVVSAHALALAKGTVKSMTAAKIMQGLGLMLATGIACLSAALTIVYLPEANVNTLSAQGRDASPAAAAAEKWGPEVNGLQARVFLPMSQFTVGAPIEVDYVVRNVSKVEQTLWHSGFWPNHLILVKDADGKEPPLTEFGKQCRKAFSPGGERLRNVPVKVLAGREDEDYKAQDLMKLYDLARPGRYSVQCIYEEKQSTGWQGRLPSNAAGFEVVTKAKDEDGTAQAKPIEVKGLRFVALVPKWVQAPLVGGTQQFDLGLRITNISDKPVALAINDVIRLRLNSADGEKTEMNSGRRELPKPNLPVTLAPGDSWTWESKAWLAWTGGTTLQLRGQDGRGVAGFWWFDAMKQKKYRLSVEYANSNAKQGEVDLWVGEAITKEVELEIVPWQRRPRPGPAVVEGLSFEALVPNQIPLLAPGRSNNVDLWLRVTNVSDKPMTLWTFDVIRPRLYTGNGKELETSIGRNGQPALTPPVLLAPGLRWTWRSEAKLVSMKDGTTLLRGPDGLGVPGAWSFLSLNQGKYRLVIEYANDKVKQGDVPLWTGKAATRPAEFEIVPGNQGTTLPD